MKIVTSTDGKYVGTEVPSSVQVGEVVALGDFILEVQFVKVLEDGRVCVGNPNYQIVLEEA